MAGALAILGLSIPIYVWLGILLLILGFVVAIFVPVIGQRIGLLMIIIGLVLSVGVSLLESLFSSLFENTTFVAILIGSVTLILVLWILFPQSTNQLVKKK